MRALALAITASLAALASGCGGGDGDFDAPTCAAGQVAVDGTIAFPGLAYGNCDDDGFPGTLRMNADGDSGAFRLRDLHPGADCNAAQASGELTGCFATTAR